MEINFFRRKKNTKITKIYRLFHSYKNKFLMNLTFYDTVKSIILALIITLFVTITYSTTFIPRHNLANNIFHKHTYHRHKFVAPHCSLQITLLDDAAQADIHDTH